MRKKYVGMGLNSAVWSTCGSWALPESPVNSLAFAGELPEWLRRVSVGSCQRAKFSSFLVSSASTEYGHSMAHVPKWEGSFGHFVQDWSLQVVIRHGNILVRSSCLQWCPFNLCFLSDKVNGWVRQESVLAWGWVALKWLRCLCHGETLRNKWHWRICPYISLTIF